MKAILDISLIVALLAGCSATPPPDAATAERRVQFACTNGEHIEMRFLAHGVGVLVRNGKPLELQQHPAASGFLYSDGPNTVRGKGDELTVEIGRMVPLTCKAN